MSVSFPPGFSIAAGPGRSGRLLLIFRAAVRARKRRTVALRGGEREPPPEGTSDIGNINRERCCEKRLNCYNHLNKTYHLGSR